MWNKLVPVVPLYSDFKPALDKVYNKTHNGKSKPIRLRHSCRDNYSSTSNCNRLCKIDGEFN